MLSFLVLFRSFQRGELGRVVVEANPWAEGHCARARGRVGSYGARQAVGKEPISRSFCENRKNLRFKGLIKINFAFFVFRNKLLFCVVLLTVQVEWFSIKIEPVFSLKAHNTLIIPS